MGDRSDEATTTRDGPRSTDELLAETDRLLSESSATPADEVEAGTADEVEAGTADESRRRRSTSDAATGESVRSRLPVGRLFSSRAVLALALALGAGLLVGGTVLPFAGIGRFVGLAVAAFLAGLVGSRRRYLETAVAGASVGGVAALSEFVTAAVFGFGGSIAAVGAGAGLLVAVVGYYFGRDLRDGLDRDL